MSVRVFRAVLPLVASAALATAPLHAQSCERIFTRTAPTALSGRQIDSVRIVTLDPVPLPGPSAVTAVADRLHMRTQEGTIRRELLFEPGHTVDTMRIAETMRRLRGRRYIADAWMEAVSCGPDSAVTLTVTTRDSWSARPEVKVGSSGGATIGLEERNLLGTGRSAGLFVRASGSRTGIGASLSDPWIPHTNLAATLRTDSYRDGSAWLAAVETRRLSIFEPWQAQLAATGSVYRGSSDTAGVFARDGASLLVSRGINASPRGVTSLIAGAEITRGRLFSGPARPVLGPATVVREFIGMDLGARRETASYDTLTWMLAGQAFAEVPRGLEGEAVLGLGRDFASRQSMAHLDMWAGQVWTPRPGRMLVGDIWSSGFVGTRGIAAGAVRAHLTYYGAARGGLWMAHLAAEQLFNPDPDIRALAALDPTLPLYPKDSRLAETAIATSVERNVHLGILSRSLALDGALFGAFSLRSDLASPTSEHLYAGVLGFGLRLAPLRTGRATLRLDLGFPVAHSPELRGRPYIGVQIVPWLGANRQRGERREP